MTATTYRRIVVALLAFLVLLGVTATMDTATRDAKTDAREVVTELREEYGLDP